MLAWWALGVAGGIAIGAVAGALVTARFLVGGVSAAVSLLKGTGAVRRTRLGRFRGVHIDARTPRAAVRRLLELAR